MEEKLLTNNKAGLHYIYIMSLHNDVIIITSGGREIPELSLAGNPARYDLELKLTQFLLTLSYHTSLRVSYSLVNCSHII